MAASTGQRHWMVGKEKARAEAAMGAAVIAVMGTVLVVVMVGTNA